MLKRKRKEKEVKEEVALDTSSEETQETIEATFNAEEVVVNDVPQKESEVAQPDQESTTPTESSEDKLSQLTNTLNFEFKKAGNGLTSQIAKVSNNLAYVLIKAANSAYCFARIGGGREGSRAELELEFLSNVPAEAHRQIFEICKSLNISDSKRLFFHPSGIL
jgi:hypothetical protein